MPCTSVARAMSGLADFLTPLQGQARPAP